MKIMKIIKINNKIMARMDLVQNDVVVTAHVLACLIAD
jgi:hypothetical protein